MAAPATQGTICTYGISGSTLASAVIVGKDITRADRNLTETKNETGQVIGIRMDDYLDSGSVTIQIQAGITLPTPGALMFLSSIEGTNVTFLVSGLGRAETNTDNVRVTVNLRKDENITYT